MMVAYIVSLALFLRLPEKLQSTAMYMMIGGGVLAATGVRKGRSGKGPNG